MTGNPRDIVVNKSEEQDYLRMQTHGPPTPTKRNSKDTGGTSENSDALAAGKKFMLTVRDSVFSELQKSADLRGVSIQGLIRAVIVPEWHLDHASLIRRATSQNSSFNQDQLARESVSVPEWPKTRKTVEGIPTKIVA